MAIKVETWVAWLGALMVTGVVAVFVLITFAYGNFETKENAKNSKEETQQRLVRIEDKLDRVLQNRNE